MIRATNAYQRSGTKGILIVPTKTPWISIHLIAREFVCHATHKSVAHKEVFKKWFFVALPPVRWRDDGSFFA